MIKEIIENIEDISQEKDLDEVKGNRDVADKKQGKKLAKARSKAKCKGNMSPHKVDGKNKFVCKPKDKEKARTAKKARKKLMKSAAGKKSLKVAQDTKKFRKE